MEEGSIVLHRHRDFLEVLQRLLMGNCFATALVSTFSEAWVGIVPDGHLHLHLDFLYAPGLALRSN